MQKLRSGTIIDYNQLAEAVGKRKAKRSRTTIVQDFGRVDEPAVVKRLRRLAKSILKRCSPDEIVADLRGRRFVEAWPYGDLHALEAL
jgi:hypothetical protein